MEQERKEITYRMRILKETAELLLNTVHEGEDKELNSDSGTYNLRRLIELENRSKKLQSIPALTNYAKRIYDRASQAYGALLASDNTTDAEYVQLDEFMKRAVDLRNFSEGIEQDPNKSEEIIENIKRTIYDLEKSSEGLHSEIQSTRNNFLEIKSEMIKIIEDTQNQYINTIEGLRQQEKEVSDLVKLIAKKGISGDFESSAAKEEVTANSFRVLSIALMITMVAIIAYTLLETTESHFKWENSIFRISLAFIMLIPATYLAKESTKHREQQHIHHEKSLILKAIDPYINSFPDQEKQRIKHEIASRIFSINNTKTNASDSTSQIYHITETIVKALKRVDEK